MIILFEHTEAASEAAYILRGEWDGLNGVIVQNLDLAALKFVADQVQSDYCLSGQFYYLSITAKELLSQYSNGIRDFQGAYLSFLDLSGLNLSGIDLTDANLAQANLQGTNLMNAILRNANLTGANLAKADLTGADLAGAYMREAILLQTKLAKTNLKAAFYEDAILDKSNKLLVKLFVQNLFYELRKFKNIKHFGYLYGWLSILLFGTAFVITITYLPFLAIVFSIAKGIIFGIATGLFTMSLVIGLQHLVNIQKNLFITAEWLPYILVLMLILSILGELNHALKEAEHMFVYFTVGGITVVGALLSTLQWLKRIILY